MSEKKSKIYTVEFKESAVKLAVESDQPVTETARDLGVNVNTLHTWIGKYHRPKTSGKAEKNDEHVYDELKRLRKENARLKEEELACITKRRFKATTDSRHNKPVADNLLERDFHQDQPNQAYVGDITYIPTREGWLYLSVFIDLCSRAVVGWSMSNRMTAKMVTDSLEMAMWKRRPQAGLLVHSDRGSQYVSERYQSLLKAMGSSVA